MELRSAVGCMCKKSLNASRALLVLEHNIKNNGAPVQPDRGSSEWKMELNSAVGCRVQEEPKFVPRTGRSWA